MGIESKKISAALKIQFFIKRMIDIIVSAAGLVLLFPVLALIAVAIKLTSKGPVFFQQDRVGKDVKIFKFLKFRTMVPEAVNMGAGLRVTPDDPRITRVGRILRKTSLDELPQLFNVLKGDISLVGPRPTVPQHLEYYGDFERRRLEVKPGITGLAMVRGRGSVPWSVRIKYDVEYVDNFSLWLDLKILAETLWVVLARKNIYYDYEKHGPAFDLVKPSDGSGSSNR
ncbi:MAG: sugar transferase [Sedimentisphaerales bacterium]|jgi:exopolysaccharide biosynthesis polyprenyl glycosylphosphotransferase